MTNNKPLQGSSEHQIQLLAMKGLEARANKKKYTIWHIGTETR